MNEISVVFWLICVIMMEEDDDEDEEVVAVSRAQLPPPNDASEEGRGEEAVWLESTRRCCFVSDWWWVVMGMLLVLWGWVGWSFVDVGFVVLVVSDCSVERSMVVAQRTTKIVNFFRCGLRRNAEDEQGRCILLGLFQYGALSAKLSGKVGWKMAKLRL